MALVVSLCLLSRAEAQERTGEVLRELLRGVEQDFETLQRETQGMSQRAEALRKELEGKAKALEGVRNPVERKAQVADLLLVQAQLNELDRKETDAALRTIGEVRWKLERIRGVLQRGLGLPPKEQLPAVRQKLGGWLTTAAHLLEAMERRMPPDQRQEITSLKGTLVGVLRNWEAPTLNVGGAEEELARTLRRLDLTYVNLVGVMRALEQERQFLLIRNNAAVADLVLIRLNGGKVNVGAVSEAVEAKRKAIGRRMEIMTRADREGLVSSGGEGSALLSTDQQQEFERLKRGEYQWLQGGAGR
jgi:hypothetical protein